VNSTSAQQLHFAFTGMSAWHSTISRYGVSIQSPFRDVAGETVEATLAHRATGRVAAPPGTSSVREIDAEPDAKPKGAVSVIEIYRQWVAQQLIRLSFVSSHIATARVFLVGTRHSPLIVLQQMALTEFGRRSRGRL
jgi:hypothetical protein